MRSTPFVLSIPVALLTAGAVAQSTSATYQLTFNGAWSGQSHPAAYPFAAHFSPLIGATHNADVSFWSPGGLASPGIESMAETGSTTGLRAEINAFAAEGYASTPIGGRGFNSPGSTTLTFQVSSTRPTLTMVSMVAPSPDWFVGVHGLELMTPMGWADELVIPLFAYDAGTDSGTNFNSIDANTVPQEPIASFLSTAPFSGLPQLGTFTLRLLSVEVCFADANSDGALTTADFNTWIAAFNAQSPACDQNGDNACTPADFSAWIANFNAGC